MLRNARGRRAHSHHALLTNAWTVDVQTLERRIGEFETPPLSRYHVALFEMDGDPHLHVNVTHGEEAERVRGWMGPGVSAEGFIYSRRFEPAETASILGSIHAMVFAPRRSGAVRATPHSRAARRSRDQYAVTPPL